MRKQILVSTAIDELRVALLENGSLVEFYLERPTQHRLVGNIYKARVENVLPGMEAAFVDIGLDKNAFLYVEDALPPAVSEDLDKSERPRARNISELLKPGQSIVAQVVKEAFGTKGARVSTHFTLPGRYLVLMPTVDYVGVSRRIEDQAERERLRQLAESLERKGHGLIVRTVAEGKSQEDLASDLKFLLKLWDNIQKRAKNAKTPTLLYSNPGLLYRVVRDMLSPDTEELLVDSQREYLKLLEIVNMLCPELQYKLRLYVDRKETLFDLYGVEEQVAQALARRVGLKSGGYIVIDRCEALTAIDVNTGRYVGKKSLSETVFQTNLEAADEIARQIRLRDIGGIIIVDFIDMDKEEQRQTVLERLKEKLRLDRTPTTVLGFTELGLLQLTRKKTGVELWTALQQPCPYCKGTGKVLTEAAIASMIRREVAKVLSTSASEAILVEVHPSVASLLIGPGGSNLKELERSLGRFIFVRGAEGLHLEEMSIKAMGKRDEVERRALPVAEGQVVMLLIENPHSSHPNNGIGRVEGFVVEVEGAGSLAGCVVEAEITKVSRTSARARLLDRGENEP
ncbi:MAG: Rne/Rng family ribonuclease [Bacillota bacterium]